VFATSSLFAATTSVTLQTASSETFTAYVAGPKEAGEGIVLIHDWFGVTPFYTAAAEKLANEGYRVVALDLYNGHGATTMKRPGLFLARWTATLQGARSMLQSNGLAIVREE
jgi:dienelactone hydrolase